ncbi:hypothetical protein ACODHD_13075, partial [Vagococcus fluvialis]|uniref:hypothetical protein n=1 Tax=Vagococcus fluvialis TaxID=2738 RepID=UPI003B5C32C8
ACLNIKKLAKMLKLRDLKGSIFLSILGILSKIMIRYKKTNQLLFMSNWFVFNLKSSSFLKKDELFCCGKLC